MIARSVVRIDEVDWTRRTVHVTDKTGAKFKAGFWMSGTMFQVPAQNELWLIVRQGYQWHLEKRWDRVGEATGFDALMAGDVRLRVPETSFLESHPFGATRHEQFTS